MDDMKIRILSEEHSKQVQEKLRYLGYYWYESGTGPIHLTAKYLYTYFKTKEILRGDDTKYFEAHKSIEYFLVNGRLVKDFQGTPEVESKYATTPSEPFKDSPNTGVKKPPLGLRPRKFVVRNRIEEILEAMLRYNEAEERIPDDWIDELEALNDMSNN